MNRGDRATSRVEPRDAVAVPDSWTLVAPHVYEIRSHEPIPEWSRRWRSDAFASHLLGREVRATDLSFIDCETTGLSGGAGTSVFLVGVGRVMNGRIEVVQYLLSDFPGERDYLERVLDGMGRATVWVSYNGKAFDARLIETRCVMNGIAPPSPTHVDLLYWARRLWRRMLPDCSLSSVEAGVLGCPRDADIPGAEIPDRYFEYLRSRDAGALEPVVEHHRRDIVSLAQLFLTIEGILDAIPAPDGETRDPAGRDRAIGDRPVRYDSYQLGRWLLASGDRRGVGLLQSALDPSLCLEVDDCYAAGYLVARHYRRSGDHDLAEKVLVGLLGVGGATGPGSAVAAATAPSRWLARLVIEYAKLLEHDRRDPARALDVIEAARCVVDRYAASVDLERREQRLRRAVNAKRL